MKIKITVLFFFLILQVTKGQSGKWAWIHGDTIATSPGHFGIKGIADPANRPPGLYEAYNWTDSKGFLWIYGGYNSAAALYANMWKYNPYTNLWTWIQGDSMPNTIAVHGTLGVPSPLNTPGARNTGVSWVDNNGNFWLYGGFINGLAKSGDLWMFNPLTLEWTWMSGSLNVNTAGTLVQGVPSSVDYPPSIVETKSGWIDSQDQLWIYGGIYINTCCAYDRVLRYSISTNEWTWIRGSIFNQAPPVWGSIGVPSAANNPGAGSSYAHWEDTNGNFWFANGYTYAAAWRYNPVSNEWTWMTGNQTPNNMGNYVSYCDTVSGNFRSHSEENSACFKDKYEQVWQFAGTSAVSNSNYNDLWIFDYATLKYKWMHGTNLLDQPAVYGQLGIPSYSNIPHSRDGAILFGDTLCNVFLFAGLSRHPGQATYNDVWKFTSDSSCSKCFQALPIASFTAPNQVCPGTCIDFLDYSLHATAYQWSFPGATPNTSTQQNPDNICYNAPGSYDVTLIVSNANGTDTLILLNYITVYPYPSPQGIMQSGDTLFANAGAVTYQWYLDGNILNGATDYFYVASQSGNYNVVCTDSNNCEVEAAIFDVIAHIHPVISGNTIGNGELIIFPNPVTDMLTIQNPNLLIKPLEIKSISIFNTLGKIIIDHKIPATGCIMPANVEVSILANGMYWIEIITGDKTFRAKFIKR